MPAPGQVEWPVVKGPDQMEIEDALFCRTGEKVAVFALNDPDDPSEPPRSYELEMKVACVIRNVYGARCGLFMAGPATLCPPGGRPLKLGDMHVTGFDIDAGTGTAVFYPPSELGKR